MRTIRNRRARLIAGTVGLAIAATGLGLAAPGVASAATGLQPGALVLSPASGTPVATPAWTTTTACPSTESAAGAGIAVFDLSGNFIENVTGEVAPSAVTTPGFGSASPGDGAFASDMGQIAAIGGLDSSTVEFVVACVNSLDPVDFLPEMSTFVTFDAQGNWTSSATPPPPPPPGALNTATVLAASANPATVGQRVTLTATELASDRSHPAGSVQFLDGDTVLGSPVSVNANGVAKKPVTFKTPNPNGENLVAVFTPGDPSSFNSSTGTLTLQVNRRHAHTPPSR